MALDQPHPLGEERGIAAKLIDEEPFDHGRVGRIKHHLGADDLGDDAAAINIAEQDHRNVGGAGETHVRNVILAQIDFRRAAGPFDNDNVGLGAKPRETVEHGGEKLRLPLLVIPRARLADDAALRHHLRAAAAMRLQKHGVHVDGRRDATGFRLHRLGAADLAAVRRDRRVVRHILRLEWPDGEPALAIGPAEPGDDQRFADVGARSLQHNRLRPPRHGPRTQFLPAPSPPP